MEQTITLSALIQMGLIIMGFWGFVKIVKEIVKSITDRHDREQKWDKMVQNVQEERDKIYKKYDTKLAEMEEKIDGNYADTGAKFQQIYAELEMLTDCMAAVLDGLHQLNCNGAVTNQREALDKFMRKKAHEQD